MYPLKKKAYAFLTVSAATAFLTAAAGNSSASHNPRLYCYSRPFPLGCLTMYWVRDYQRLERNLALPKTRYGYFANRQGTIAAWEWAHALWKSRDESLRWRIRTPQGIVAVVFRRGLATADCIVWDESRWNPSAQNPQSSAAGLFQTESMWWDGASAPEYPAINPYNPISDTVLAWKMSEGGRNFASWHGDCGW